MSNSDVEALLDEVIDTVLVDTYGDEEQLTAWEVVLEETIGVPVEAVLLGQPVTVTKISVIGGRPEVTADCRTAQGVSGEIAVADLVFPPSSEAAWPHAAYRRFLGLDPFPAASRPDWTWPPD
ncbi:calcium-binding protein [Streptomyces sp. NPDC026589]|uniref:calcium-binding protein n=1 Tax=Streptomyces sp. NPDC026589 TaxID=3155609 RepID=UPI0033DCA303